MRGKTNTTKQWKNPETGPHKYGQLFFNKGAITFRWRKNVFRKGCGNNWTLYAIEIKKFF